MKRRKKERPRHAAEEPLHAPSASPRLLTWIVALGALTVPLFVLRGEDLFRWPKEILVRFEAILIVTVVTGAFALGRGARDWGEAAREKWTMWLAAVVVWTGITTIFSSNRLISISALGYVLAMAAVFAGTFLVMRRGGIALAAVPLVAAAVNILVLALQYLRVWSPYRITRQTGMIPTGMVGNSSDLGCYMMVVSLGAAALALASKRWQKVAAAGAIAFAFGTFLSAALTAVASLAVGMLVLAAMRSRRLVVATLLVITLLGGLAFAVYPPVQQRVDRIVKATARGDLDEVFSFRFVAFLTAWLMTVDDPMTGVGPGAYGARFLEYREKADARYPFLAGSGARMFNFGEAHNDHLQTLAQSGVPGYALFLAGFVLLGRISRRPEGLSEEARFARYLALPMAIGFGVLALAQFPLELAAPLHTLVYYAAAALAWSNRP